MQPVLEEMQCIHFFVGCLMTLSAAQNTMSNDALMCGKERKEVKKVCLGPSNTASYQRRRHSCKVTWYLYFHGAFFLL
jgi:hypothetical protein